MRLMLIAAIVSLAAPHAHAASQFATVPEYQQDLDSAKPCREMKGRKMWKGKLAFYRQGTVFGKGGPLADDYADAVPFKGNTKDVFAMYDAYCK